MSETPKPMLSAILDIESHMTPVRCLVSTLNCIVGNGRPTGGMCPDLDDALNHLCGGLTVELRGLRKDWERALDMARAESEGDNVAPIKPAS